MGAATSHLTIAAAVRHEPDKIKGSRFVAYAAPISDETQAQAVVDSERQRFNDARHHCFAWRLGREGRGDRSSDADEPGGSAGAPILRQIEGRELEGVVIVVTRWFGGVKLGVGGLMRAYGGAAGGALERAEIVRVERMVRVRVEHDFGASGLVESLLRATGGRSVHTNWTRSVEQFLDVPLAQLELFLNGFRDGTSGRGRAQRMDGA